MIVPLTVLVAGVMAGSPLNVSTALPSMGLSAYICICAYSSATAATAINNNGQVTGYFHPTVSTVDAFISNSGTGQSTALGGFGGGLSVGYAINNNGQVTGGASYPGAPIVGYEVFDGPARHAFL